MQRRREERQSRCCSACVPAVARHWCEPVSVAVSAWSQVGGDGTGDGMVVCASDGWSCTPGAPGTESKGVTQEACGRPAAPEVKDVMATTVACEAAAV
jgi:hypothetical protein